MPIRAQGGGMGEFKWVASGKTKPARGLGVFGLGRCEGPECCRRLETWAM